MLDCGVFDDFAQDAAVTASDDEDGFGIRVGVHGEVGYHFLVAILLSVSCVENGGVFFWLGLTQIHPALCIVSRCRGRVLCHDR